jgi:flagellar motor switch protein FliG
MSGGPVPVTDIATLTKVQKLAIFLILLGQESAAQILKNLDEHERRDPEGI